jgi:thymidylate synthase (FAD)
MASVKLIAITPEPEKTAIYIARVSNPANQDNPNISGLMKYLIDHKHWSPFEHSFMTVEIKTSRAIAAQILRHRSFSFQEFSQRYSIVTEYEIYDGRKQAEKNRQSSTDELDPDVLAWFYKEQYDNTMACFKRYNDAIAKGVAKEQARFLLPQQASTTMYMSGSLRSWIHYIDLRTKDDVQQEHKEIAEMIRDIFIKQCPVISHALNWS